MFNNPVVRWTFGPGIFLLGVGLAHVGANIMIFNSVNGE